MEKERWEVTGGARAARAAEGAQPEKKHTPKLDPNFHFTEAPHLAPPTIQIALLPAGVLRPPTDV